MRHCEERAERMFRLVCLSFSAMLLVLSLFWQIRLVRLQEQIGALESEIRTAQDEGKQLAIKLETSPTLEQLEEIAVTRFGMQHPTQGQLAEIDYLG